MEKYTMLNAQEFLAKIDDLGCDDLRIIEISALHFGEEVRIRIDYKDDEDGVITFLGCDRVEMQHYWTYKRFAPEKELTFGQLDHFTHEFKVEAVEVEGNEYYKVSVDLFPMEMVVYCRDVKCEIVKNPARGQDCERYRELPEGYTY
jgi:uncharacterized protein YfbU (UPF0304 family)